MLSNGPTIEVSIKEPKFAFSELRKVYSLPTYNLTYWKDGQKEKVAGATLTWCFLCGRR